MRIITIVLAALTISVSAFSQAKKPPVKKTTPVKTAAPKPLLKSGVDSLSYAIGINIGANMKAQGIEQINYIAFNKGMADAIKEVTAPLMNQEECNMTIQQKLQEYMAKKNSAVKEEGRKFLAENKKQPGVVELPTGVQYKIMTQGTGAKPALEDTIRFNYKGTTLDGNVFDDSYSRGEPVEYPLNQLVDGWKQTVILMPVGSKWQLFIPSEYGYGERGNGGSIPGGATIVFELELLDIKPVKK